MEPVVGERLRQNLRPHYYGGECKQVLVRLNFYLFWNSPDPPEQVGTDRHAARAEKSTAPAKQARTFHCIGLEAKSLAESLGLLAPIAVNADNAVAHNPRRGIGGHSLHHARQLIACPPVIAIQKRNDLAF